MTVGWTIKKNPQLLRFPLNFPNRQKMSNRLLWLHKVGQYSEIAIPLKKTYRLDLAL